MKNTLVLSLCLMFATNAYAYLDPGTVSFALQSLIAAATGGLLTAGMFGKTIWVFLTKPFRHKPNINSSKTLEKNNQT